MLWASAPVLGVLRAALGPGLLQVLGAATARVVLVVVGAVGAAGAGGAAAITHVAHAGCGGGGELAQAGLAVDGAAAARAARALLLVQQHAQLLELHVLLHHFLLLHLQLLKLLQVQGHFLVHHPCGEAAQSLPLPGHPLAFLPVVIQETAEVPQLLVVLLEFLVDILKREKQPFNRGAHMRLPQAYTSPQPRS